MVRYFLICSLTMGVPWIAVGNSPGAETDSTGTRLSADGDRSARAVWSAVATHTFLTFTSDRPTWRTESVILRRRVARRSTFDFEAARVTRHGEHSLYGAVDAYRNFGPRVYANVRLAVAPGAEIIPRTDIFVEAFRSAGAGWEVSAGYRWANYAQAGASTWSIGVARYFGNWYARVKPSATHVAGSFGYAVLGTLRRYSGDGEGFVGLTIAKGREVVAFPGETGVAARNPMAGILFYQRDVGASAGLRIGIEAVDDGGLSRWGLLTGLVWRW